MGDIIYIILKRVKSVGQIYSLINKYFNAKSKPKDEHKENSNFIFFFGTLGCGKSTIGAAVGSLMLKHPNINLRPNMNDSEGSQFLFTEWIDKIKSYQFPSRSHASKILEVDMGFQLADGDIIPLTLIEISGERFDVIDPTQKSRYKGEMDQESLDLLIRSKVCFVVIDASKYGKDDNIIGLFLHHLNEIVDDTDLDMSVAIVLSKWDLIPDNTTPRVFIEHNLPYTYGIIQQGLVDKVFTFSIGDTNSQEVSNKATINKIEWADSKKILKWLWKVLS